MCRDQLIVCRIKFLDSLELFMQKTIIVRATEKMCVLLARANQNEQCGVSLKLLILSKQTYG